MKKYLIVALLASLLAGCAHDSPCVPVYDSQGRLVHTNTCMKGTTEDNWDTAGAIAGGAAAGRAAAIRLRQKGVDDVVVLEREHRPGGILRQCIRPHVRDRCSDPLDRFPNRRYRYIPCICSTPFPKVSDHSGSS